MRILLTSILRSYWLMLHIMLFVMTQGSTGSAILFTSTESSGASLPLGRSTGVYEERDICTTRIVLLAGQPGRETTLSPSADTVEFIVVLELVFLCFFFFLEGKVVIIMSLKFWILKYLDMHYLEP